MPFTLRLDDARSQLTFLAAIDGKVGANARFSPTNLNALLNRHYRMLRSTVSQLGYPQFLGPASTATALPGPLAGEDYQEISMPATTQEIAGVSVFYHNEWRRLDPIELGQHREGNNMDPSGGVGFWTIIQAPSVDAASTLTAGKLAVWPKLLTGLYKINYVSDWTAITNDAHVFMLYEGWDEWFLNSAALTCCQRDANKKTNWDTINAAFTRADALVQAGAARLQRGGSFSPAPYGGINL